MTTTTVRVPRSEQDLLTRMAKALAHPLRSRILHLIAEAPAQGVSPNEMTKATGEPLGNVSYHTKALLELGLIDLSDTAQRRGAIEHYYTLSGSAEQDLRSLQATIGSLLDG